MSLCIATSVPDGIVLASDTLQTMGGIQSQQVGLQCTTCKSESHITINIPIPFGTFPTTKKQHHLHISKNDKDWSLGLLHAGALNIGTIRMSKLIRDFETTIKISDRMETIATNLKDLLEKTILTELKLAKLQDYNEAINIILVGYDRNDENKQKKFIIQLNKSTPSIATHHAFGAAWIGRAEIPSLFNDQKTMSQFGMESINLLFNSMNIQDAIDYNRFLINTVIGYQKLAPMTPDVGGEIEIGILCLGKSYTWINRIKWQ